MYKKSDDVKKKRRDFVEYYMQSGNASEAAIKAGYSPKSARFRGHKLLQDPEIKNELEKLTDKLSSERIADADEILSFLTAVLRGEIKDYVLRGIGQGEQTITSIPPSLQVRIKAAELLGRRLRLFNEKVELDIKSPVVFINEDNIAD